MYAPYFGLTKEPFSIAPDPRFLYMSEQHREALAHLLYGLSGGGGFVLLTGEIGAGKTTVFRCFLEQLPAHCAVAYVFNPKQSAIEMLQTVCDEFGIAAPTHSASVKAHVDALNAFLLTAHAQGRQAVLVIDEAQALGADVLEQLRLLTNLETAERKLLQIVLIGQPELRDMLARPELEQLAQRVIARFHLGALSLAETQQYIRHRLAVAGPSAPLPFDNAALARIHALSGGVPRRINLLADRALLGAYAQGRSKADRRTVQQAAREVFARRSGAAQQRRLRWALGGAAAAGVLVAATTLAWQAGRTRAPDAVAGAGAAPGASAAAGGVASGARASAGVTTVGVAATVAAVGAVAGAPGTAASLAAPAAVAASAAVAGLGTASTTVLAATAAAAASAPPPVSADPAALLAAAHPDQATAWRELALHFNVAIGEGAPCVAVVQAQLACFRSAAGGLPVVRQLARPGVVTLYGATGLAVHALLVALDDRQATLQAADKRFVLTLPALARVWRGEFASLWRTPPGWRDSGDALSSSAARGWIEQQLQAAGWSGERPLRERVQAFQLAQGLPPDGLAGPITLMRLNRSAGVDEPRLAGTN